jgi:DNA transposition AAA+ family ATPase
MAEQQLRPTKNKAVANTPEIMNQANVPTVAETDKAIRFDTPTVTARTAHYPDELKEPVLWLATFAREECNRDLAILAEHAHDLGIEFDETTWSRILRGRWNRDAAGNELLSPLTSLAKLTKAIDLLRKDAALREQAGKVPFVMTPTAQMIFDFIDKKRAPDRVNKFGMIVGHTGTQKTATLKEYCRRNNHGAVVRTEAPETASHTQFITDLAERYGCSRQANWDRKRNTIAQSVNRRRTIIVENVQRLYDERQGGNQKVFSYLQKLQDDKDCTIILTLTPVFVGKLKSKLAEGYFEQFIGRAGGERDILTLEEFPSDEDVLAIAKSFKLVDAAKHLAELAKIVREAGRVRVLFEGLQEAKLMAGKKELTINHVRAAREED